MEFLIIIVLVFIVIAVIEGFSKGWIQRMLGGERKKFPYLKKKYFLTKAEMSFFRVLEQAIENKYYIFPQVHLSDLIYTTAKRKNYYRYLNKINRKSVDFVLVEKNYLNPLLAIELDDSSHNNEGRIKRDEFVEDAFEDAGLPLLRIKNSYSYDIQKVKELINNSLKEQK
ncbi:DUF2726 domain-containing protein [Patescibacteria group bacterium]